MKPLILAEEIQGSTLWQFAVFATYHQLSMAAKPSGTAEAGTKFLLNERAVLSDTVTDTKSLLASSFVSLDIVVPTSTLTLGISIIGPIPTASITATATVITSASTSNSTSTTSPSASGVFTSYKGEIIIGVVSGTSSFIFTGVILALFRRRLIGHRQSKGLLTPYDLKISKNPDVKTEATSKDNEIVLSYVSPTSRQRRLQAQAGSIREEISAILEVATIATGFSQDIVVTQDTVVAQRHIIQDLTERVIQLEELLTTDWARELTDEPPPQYSENLIRAV